VGPRQRVSVRLHHLALAIGLGFCVLLCGACVASDAAKDAATGFYRSYAKLRAAGGMTGIPDAAQLTKLAPLLTPELRKLFVAAKKEQERCAKKFPDDKPPWIEGDIFSSNFEGFTKFRVDASRDQGGGRVVTVRFEYAEGKSRVKWADMLVLRNESGRWLVEDVLYRAKFAFTSGFGKNLKDSLMRIPAC